MRRGGELEGGGKWGNVAKGGGEWSSGGGRVVRVAFRGWIGRREGGGGGGGWGGHLEAT